MFECRPWSRHRSDAVVSHLVVTDLPTGQGEALLATPSGLAFRPRSHVLSDTSRRTWPEQEVRSAPWVFLSFCFCMPKKRKASKSSRVPSTRASARLYQSRPSTWFLNTEGSRDAQHAWRAHFRDGIKLVRQFYAGFDPGDGFDLRHVRYWTDARVATLNRFIGQANRLTSGEFHELYTLHRPRSAEQRRALILHSGLVSPDEDRHPQRAWPIYANTRDVELRYVKETVPKPGVPRMAGLVPIEERLRVEVRRRIKGGALVHRDYLFREVLGFQPGLESTSAEGLRAAGILGSTNPWQQMVAAMRLLLPRLPDRTRKGNEAYYRLLSDRGPIGTSVPKHMLIERMQEWGEDYNDKFVAILIGVRYQGDEFEAVRGPKSLDAKSDRRRARYAELARDRQKARARIGPRGDVLPRKPKRKTQKKSRGPVKQARKSARRRQAMRTPRPFPRETRKRTKGNGVRRKK